MTDPIWPITNTLIHTRGSGTKVSVHELESGHAVITIVIGGASDLTIHTHSMEEIIDIQGQLNEAIFTHSQRKTP